MKLIINAMALCAMLALTATVALAHSGGTDSCGGHNNRKTGEYHVHNYSKYCACYPDSKLCKKDDDKSKKEKATEKKLDKE